MGEIFITVIFAVAIPAVFLPLYFKFRALFYSRKMPYDAVCVKNGVLIAALFITILLYAATVICGITCTILAPARATYISVSVLGAFTVIFSLAYLHDKFQYIAAEETGVTDVCIFRKDKIIPYEKIKYYHIGYIKWHKVITLLNRNGIPLLTISNYDKYLDIFLQKLEEFGVSLIPDCVKFPTEEMRKSDEYKAFRKKETLFALIIIEAFLCFCCMLIFGLIFGFSATDHYHAGHIIAFVFLGIDCVSFVGTIICIILLCVHMRKCAKK